MSSTTGVDNPGFDATSESPPPAYAKEDALDTAGPSSGESSAAPSTVPDPKVIDDKKEDDPSEVSSERTTSPDTLSTLTAGKDDNDDEDISVPGGDDSTTVTPVPPATVINDKKEVAAPEPGWAAAVTNPTDGEEAGPSQRTNNMTTASPFVPEIITTNGNDKAKELSKEQEASADVESQETPERMQWDSQWEFLMSCISMSVGLGNVWRFPVTAYENGGGAFLIPYLVVLIFIGRPIYFLELCLGQFTSYSQVKCWKAAPFYKGVGYGAMVATMAVLTYYVYIMAMTVYYFIVSFQKTLPWSDCQDSWAGEGMCFPNGSSTVNRSVPEMYFYDEVIKESTIDNIDDGVGKPDWKLSLCLLFSWVIIFGSLIRGVHSSGKVAYFTAIFPYVVMLILLIRGLTLEGAGEGIKYFVKPDFEKLLEPGVWYAAVSQCFFSLNTGFGSIIMFSSYNPFSHNIYRDAWIVSFMDTFTSLLAGFTIFAVLGNLAHELNMEVPDVVRGGAGLAFVSYPDAIAKFDWVPQLFAVLFFLMLFTLGLGSSVSDAGAIITIFCDKFPNLVRWHVTLVLCIIGMAIGIVYTTPGGQYILELVDFFGGGFVIYTTSILEVIGIAWVYGLYNYLDDIEFMLNIRLGWYWKICWGIIIPIFLTAILIYSLIEDIEPTYNDIRYPVIALVFGWGLAVIALAAFPAGGIQAMTKIPGTLKEKLIGAHKPAPSWGPRNPKKRLEWMEFKASRPQMTLMERMRAGKL